jgi:hypothetical protein
MSADVFVELMEMMTPRWDPIRRADGEDGGSESGGSDSNGSESNESESDGEEQWQG